MLRPRIRSYAFGIRSGRVSPGALETSFLSKCETEVVAAGTCHALVADERLWDQFPRCTKRVMAAGWYFSTDQAFDIAWLTN